MGFLHGFSIGAGRLILYDIGHMEFLPDDPRVTFLDEGDGIYQLDVRELLLSGGEPYQAIMQCVNQLQGGEILYLHAIFEPAPLIRKLERRGFALQSEHVGPDHWRLLLRLP
jgi:uncharacterized protein (DUF2249 family)